MHRMITCKLLFDGARNDTFDGRGCKFISGNFSGEDFPGIFHTQGFLQRFGRSGSSSHLLGTTKQNQRRGHFGSDKGGS